MFVCVNLTPHLFYFSLYLYKLGIAPQIQDLLGKVAFTGNTSRNQLLLKHKYNTKAQQFYKISVKCKCSQ